MHRHHPPLRQQNVSHGLQEIETEPGVIGGGFLAHEAATEEAAGFVKSEVVAVGDNRKQPPLGAEDGLGGQAAGGLNDHPKLDRRGGGFGGGPAPPLGGGVP